MNTETIVLIVSILFVFGVYIFVLIMAGRWDFVRGFIPKRRIRVAQVLGSLFGCLVVTYLFYHLYEIEPNYWMEISLLVGLVGATVVYALLTFTQGREMREQRLSEARPYLLLRLKVSAVQWNNIKPDKHRPIDFQIIVHNAGKGPAIKLHAALWHPYKSHFVGENKGYLLSGDEWETTISRFTESIEEKEGWLPKLRDIVEQNKTEIIAVECKDIYKRTWVSYLYLEKHVYEDAFVIEGEQNIVELKND